MIRWGDDWEGRGGDIEGRVGIGWRFPLSIRVSMANGIYSGLSFLDVNEYSHVQLGTCCGNHAV